MKILGSDWSFREFILVCVVLLITMAFFLNVVALEKTVNSYKLAYSECLDSIAQYNNGYNDVYNRPLINVSGIQQ